LVKSAIPQETVSYNTKSEQNILYYRLEDGLITPSQYRMARAALDIPLRQLAAEADVAVSTLMKIEADRVSPKILRKLRVFFQERGLVFSRNEKNYPGVFFRDPANPSSLSQEEGASLGPQAISGNAAAKGR